MRVIAVALAALVPVSAVHGQSGHKRVVARSGVSATIETKHVSVTARPDRTRVAPGERVALFVDVRPKPRMHVYAPDQKDVIPVSLTLAPGHFTAHAPLFPKPERYFFAPLGETQLVYSKPFRIVQHVTTRPAASTRRGSGLLSISGSLTYQACDDAICYMPASVQLEWRLGLTDVER